MLKRNRGITLIALVITIIVLLILAGVTLNLTLGENGLLRRAEESKNAYLAGEKNDVEFMNQVYDYMNPYFGEEKENNLLEVVHKIERAGVEIPVPEGGEIYTDEKGVKIPIPQGFKYKEGTKETGLVITDELEENEFVWVPVEYVVAENGKVEEKAKDIITIEGKDKRTQIKSIENITTENIRKIEEGKYEVTENGEYVFKVTNKAGESVEYTVNVEDIIINKAMAKLQNGSDVNYEGVLYDFNETTVTELTNYGIGTDNYREPDIVTEYDGNTTYLTQVNDILGTNYTTADQFKTTLQTDYNEMVESVTKYKGFFVGRYETSLDTNKKAKSKVEANPATAITWYGLYAYQKKMAEDNNYTSVKSHMIWGSNYDAMLKWALNGADSAKVTGKEKRDRINNIYYRQLSEYEWTAETSNEYGEERVCRGEGWHPPLWYRYSYNSPAGDVFNPNMRYSYCCSHSILYIK